MSHLPILYSFRRCPYAMRARLALLNSGINCEVREVRLSNKPPELVVASPKATVPVMVLPNGRVIDESLDIMLWAMAQNDILPENYSHAELVSASYLLSPLKSKTLKQVQGDDKIFEWFDLIAQNDGVFKHHLDRYKYPEKFGRDAIEHRDAGTAILREYDAILSRQPYLSGQSLGLADYALLPFIRQFAHVDRDYFYALDFPQLIAWLTARLGEPLFANAMRRFPVWKPDAETCFLIDDHPVGSRPSGS